jgi:hypothetical protein
MAALLDTLGQKGVFGAFGIHCSQQGDGSHG